MDFRAVITAAEVVVVILDDFWIASGKTSPRPPGSTPLYSQTGQTHHV